MEVFIRGVPARVTEPQLSKAIRPVLTDLGIFDWQLQKPAQKTIGFLIFLHLYDAQRFLHNHGREKNAYGRDYLPPGRTDIHYFAAPLFCSKSSKQPDHFALESLRLESKARLAGESAPEKGTALHSSNGQGSVLKVGALACGIWSYKGKKPIFVPCFDRRRNGTLKFMRRLAVIDLDNGIRIDIPLASVKETNIHRMPQSAITMTLSAPPLFFQAASRDSSIDWEIASITEAMESLRLCPQDHSDAKWMRIPCLDSDHQAVAGTCLVYQISLENASIQNVERAMDHVYDLLSATKQHVERTESPMLYKDHMNVLLRRFQSLAMNQSAQNLPFIVMFQLQALVQNGVLPPNKVYKMLNEIGSIVARSGPQICAYAIRALSHKLVAPSENLDPHHENAPKTILRQAEARMNKGSFLPDEMPNLKGRAYIHRVTFTPAAMYLYGPEPVSNNRVLRKYSAHHDSFLRVQFCDEDGEAVRFNPNWSNDVIYYSRFKKILNEGFVLGGRRFRFLGFSHSSLRAQSCWFMAPFIHEGSLMLDRKLIQGLGNFSHIRSPAKCAARIGQAFSETTIAITVRREVSKEVNDVERNGRVFSDGVGTISKDLLIKIWAALPLERRNSMPSAFQIRFSGAKGMISYRSRLTGEQMLLRKSMVKFPAEDSLDIEICNAAYKPLPYYLNHQTIKILEDMGVDDRFFLHHQEKELDRLKLTTSSPVRAAKFLQAHSIGDNIHFPWFIKELSRMGISYLQDSFLRKVVEMALLIELRALKYKARIPISDGYTLYGLMDETGFLREGEIFCIVEKEGKPKVITGANLVISRSPALHPGDVRLVTGVSVPDSSPLRALRNCICFSSQGARDLPSQLSGGDLDGDLYQILFDPSARPKRVFTPADYPRPEALDLGRTVEREDMTDFFITFMATDQLGRIANQHKILADQKPSGVMDPDCVKLAELHSTAVDYSKSGIPVNLNMLPRSNRYRPDFMATGPRVVVQKQIPLSFDIPPDTLDDDDEDRPRHRFYESPKILGKLYRAVDEGQILSAIQSAGRAEALQSPLGSYSILEAIWAKIYQQCFAVNWRAHIPRAFGIRDEYQSLVLQYAVSYAPLWHHPLSEYEVFIGNILGQSGGQSKSQRENSANLKDNFRQVLRLVVDHITKDDDGQDSEDALGRAMACLVVGMQTPTPVSAAKGEKLSFGYVAASICLWELEHRPLDSRTGYGGAHNFAS